ncbi:MAG: FAD-dependent thymidylate synthase, partial [Terriglobales bacterium]
MPNAPSPGSAPASTFEPDVYIVQGVEPEVGAYAMAKYSRSALSLRDSLQELNRDKAEKFLNTFYFQYGHRSIADLAHLSFAVERLSILAAIEVADEPRWDGQERSTRYQRFRSSGVVLPPELDADPSSRPQLQALFAAYEALGPRLEAHLQSLHLRPDAMAEDHYRRAIRARAFDSARYLLPLATATSLGQIVSARTLEQQIVRLLSSPYAECQALGEALRRAALAPGALPTLVKYTEPSPYLEASVAELTQAAAELMAAVAPDHACGAALAPPAALEIELGASLLYAHTHHSYRQLLEAVEALTPARRDELAALGTRHRGSHDELPRAFQAGLPFQFDILMDIGGFRDLHRHRRCVQLHQGYTAQHG